MPPFRKKADDEPAKVQPACIVTLTGPVKGHPPITIEAYGSTPKDACRALQKLLGGHKLTVLT